MPSVAAYPHRSGLDRLLPPSSQRVFRERRAFFPRAAGRGEGADTSHPRAGRKARSRADRRSSRRGADVRPRRSTRARRSPPRARARARSPRRRFGTATSARRDAIELFGHPSRRSSLRLPPSTDPPFSNPSYVSSTQSSPRTVAAKPRRAAGWRPWRAASPP